MPPSSIPCRDPPAAERRQQQRGRGGLAERGQGVRAALPGARLWPGGERAPPAGDAASKTREAPRPAPEGAQEIRRGAGNGNYAPFVSL